MGASNIIDKVIGFSTFLMNWSKNSPVMYRRLKKAYYSTQLYV